MACSGDMTPSCSPSAPITPDLGYTNPLVDTSGVALRLHDSESGSGRNRVPPVGSLGGTRRWRRPARGVPCWLRRVEPPARSTFSASGASLRRGADATASVGRPPAPGRPITSIRGIFWVSASRILKPRVSLRVVELGAHPMGHQAVTQLPGVAPRGAPRSAAPPACTGVSQKGKSPPVCSM